MLRDVDHLTKRTYDVLVVGGGIYGLTIAYDAAQRGLTVALIERDDFGSGSSFNHLRTIHGGLRYLQSLDLRRARESVRERRALARIAPHAVAPLPFALPLYRSIRKGKAAMRAGMLLDRLVSADRNRDLAPSLYLPGGRVLSRAAAVERFPGLRRRGLTGAAVWHDYITPESDRLTFGWAEAAALHGAILANHVEAVEPLVEKSQTRRVIGVRSVDRLDNRTIEVGARVTINATGAASDCLLAPLGLGGRLPLLKAMNLVTSREAGDAALGGRAASGRHLFLVPWRKRALFGTWESSRVCTSGDVEVAEADLSSFITELNDAFPALELQLSDVRLVHRGLVPAAVGSNGAVALEGREQVRDHARDGVEGLMTVAGTKYTTARAVAERVTNGIFAKLQQPGVPCRTDITPLPGGGLRDAASAVADARRDYDTLVPSDTIPHLIAAYGSRYRDLLELARQRPEWRTRVAEESPVIGAELIRAVRHEMAATLCDAVLRRTPIGALGYPGDSAAQRAAEIVGAERGWTEERKRQELESLRRFYDVGVRSA
jgi:glycerol-3-phosphate dehydrogenase